MTSGLRIAVAALVAAVAAGCVDTDGESATGANGLAGESPGSPDRVIAGPQGGSGQFVVECAFDSFRADDPIVRPGEPGGSHLHQFFGAVDVSVASTYEGLVSGATTCGQQADTASYWSPALVDADGDVVVPLGSVAYYRAGPDVDPSQVVPFPPGFMMVAGDHAAVEPQPLSVVGWSCSTGARRDIRPVDCEHAPSLRMTVTFPDCWNGADVRSPIVPMPSRHVAYSAAGECPASHPVHIPQLQFAIDFPPQPAEDLAALALSSGDISSGHADFWNAWNQDKFDREVTQCIQRDLPCGVSG
jgi:hypothetical protein